MADRFGDNRTKQEPEDDLGSRAIKIREDIAAVRGLFERFR